MLKESAAEAVRKRIVNERISCRAAHEAAAEAGVSPAEIGAVLDLLEIRINGCQLGLFGHKGEDHGKADLRLPDDQESLKKAVRAECDDLGISCSDLWALAQEYGSSKMNASAVCEEEGIKIHTCRLGAF